MPASDKMTKCRNCNKDVKAADVENPDFTCDCGWNEAKAKAEVRKRKLMGDIEKEENKPTKDSEKKSIFGF